MARQPPNYDYPPGYINGLEEIGLSLMCQLLNKVDDLGEAKFVIKYCHAFIDDVFKEELANAHNDPTRIIHMFVIGRMKATLKEVRAENRKRNKNNERHP